MINVDKYVESLMYEFKKENGEEYVEIHVDMLTNYDTEDEYLWNLSFGGNLSVKKPPHLVPLIVFGQDDPPINKSLSPHMDD
jgi:hypothetical protein